jgi:hypothetical protein
MDRYHNHFPDSNIILCGIINWEIHNNLCKSYFESNTKFFSSNNVYEESLGVIERNRSWILRFIYNLNEKFKNQTSINFRRDLEEFKDDFVSKICLQDPDNCDKAYDVLTSFINDCNYPLIRIIRDSSFYKDFKIKVENSFKDVHKRLQKIYDTVLNLPTCPIDLESILADKYDILIRDVHRRDCLNLLDAHYISGRHIRDDMAFVTMDGDLFRVKTQINSVLPRIYVFKPF